MAVAEMLFTASSREAQHPCSSTGNSIAAWVRVEASQKLGNTLSPSSEAGAVTLPTVVVRFAVACSGSRVVHGAKKRVRMCAPPWIWIAMMKKSQRPPASATFRKACFGIEDDLCLASMHANFQPPRLHVWLCGEYCGLVSCASGCRVQTLVGQDR